MGDKQPRGVFQRPFDAIASVVVPVVADAVDPDDLVDRIDVNALIDRIDVDAVLERVDVNALVARIDVEALLERLDLDAVLKRVDLDALVARIDIDDIVDRVDVQRVVTRLDLNAIVDEVDVQRVVDRVDLDAVVAKVDLDAAVARVDLDAAVARVDLNAAADRIDVDRVVARADLDAAADRIDVGRVVARVDVDAIAASLDIDTIVARSTKGVFGSFVDLLRRQVVGIDEITMRALNRFLLRRDYASLPSGPPLAVHPEDAAVDGETMSGRYAGPVSRLGALALDLFVITSTFALLVAGTQFLVDVLFNTTVDLEGTWVAAVLILVYGFVYFWFSQALTGRTVSQALVGLKVIRADGKTLSPGAAAIRTLVLPFSIVLFGVGAIMALVDRQRRALHDLAARSTVVYDWGDRPAALPAPLTRFLERREAMVAGAAPARGRPSGS
jgi:uncharacterized RDD family membrane protein YckC